MKRLRNFIESIRSLCFPHWTVPLGILAAMLAAFGLLIPWLGYYWDDWTQLLVARLYDLSYYWPYFASDRPTSAWTHILFVPLLGFKPLHWQLFTLGLRWLTVLGMWWSLTLVWPQRKRTLAVAAVLFAVYPAFRQQPDVVAYHQHWLQFALYFASLGSMVLAVRKRNLRAAWMLLALVLQAAQFSITEFFAGIELIRPLLLWLVLSEEKNTKKRLGKTLLTWLPYLALLLAFSSWRLFFSGIEKHPPELLYQLLSQPLTGLLALLRLAVTDQLYIVISSWADTLNLQLRLANQPVIFFSWLVSMALALLLWVYFQRLPQDAPVKLRENREMLWLGALVTLVGPSPIWLTGGKILAENDFHADRFAMASMWGISLVLVVLVEYLVPRWRHAALILSVLIGLSAGLHIRTANEYRWIWTNQQRFYWQLLWRAPGIQTGTALVAEDTFLQHQELFSTSSALNHLYAQQRYPQQVAYWMYKLLPSVEEIAPDENLNFNTVHRIYRFSGTLDNSLVIQYQPQISGCLWVLSEDDQLNPDVSPLMRAAALHSDLSRISAQARTAAGYPPVEMIGAEPAQDWCYFYEKAELAAQQSDWAQVRQMADQAQAAGYQPGEGISNHAREWLPMIKAYLHDGDVDQAGRISQRLISFNPKMQPMLCSAWQSVVQSADSAAAAQRPWMETLTCSVE